MLYKGAAICASFVVVVDSLAKPNKRADFYAETVPTWSV